MSSRPFRRRGLSACALLGLVASPLALGAAAPVAAAPGGGALVINEVYGGGGSSSASAAYQVDFVELYNPTAGPLPVGELSLQYRSSGFTTGNVSLLPLPEATVAPGDHYLVQVSGPNATPGGAPLPTPDHVGTTLNMAAGSGQVLLVEGDERFTGTGDLAGTPGLVDMVGYGEATSYERAPTGTATSNTTSVSRTAPGVDTDSNAADFAAPAAPTPGADPAPPEEPEPATEATIADIQGDGATSPMVGERVVTEGVVTALYPGSLNGFYLQTGGTGSGTDATPGASDAVFVYGGSAFDGAGLELGDSVAVTGEVSEFGGSTQVELEADGLRQLDVALPAVTPLAVAYPTTADAREEHEGELLAPTDELTVTNVYSLNQYGEVGLATGDRPLLQPTDVAPVGTAKHDGVVADNAARAVTLDDGASTNFLSGANRDVPLPWLTRERSIRVGASVELVAPVVLEYRNNTWKLQPTEQVEDAGADVAVFEDTRPENLRPQDVGGSLSLGTFNVLNYFSTTAEEFAASGDGRTCTVYRDRTGDPVTANRCEPDGPRGAAEDEDLARQQAKIVAALNTLDADVVSLEEIENSAKMPGTSGRDEAVATLVEALNEAAGEDRWAFVPSPPASELPPLEQQDVIRTAFIYDPATVSPVGDSAVLVDEAFSNARQPLAQAFKAVDADDDETFLAVVNHFKSKGDSDPPATGDNANGPQGAFNGDRVRQAQALATFADEVAAERGTEAVFLTGDFNAYSREDPILALEDAGYSLVESDQPGDHSYSFSGLSGSLDHVLANEAALALVTGADVWEINADEPIAYQYSRHNYNATDFYAPDVFAASDHNPALVGIDFGQEAEPTVVTKVRVTPQRVLAGVSRAKLRVVVRLDGRPASGSVAIKVAGKGTVVKQLGKAGRAARSLGTFAQPGRKRFVVVVRADGAEPERTVGHVVVRPRRR